MAATASGFDPRLYDDTGRTTVMEQPYPHGHN